MSKEAILQYHDGKNVTVILDAAPSNVFQGILNFEFLDDSYCWTITSERGLAYQGHDKVAVPKTKIYFTIDDFKYLIVPLETKEEAARKIESEKNSVSLASSGYGCK